MNDIPILLNAFKVAQSTALARLIDHLQARLDGIEALNSTDGLEEAFAAVRSLRTQIAVRFLDLPVVKGDALGSAQDREYLHQVLTGTFDLAQSLQQFDLDDLRGLVGIDLDYAELDKLASNHFYSWMSGEDYVEAKLEIGALVVRAHTLPKVLAFAVEQIRSSWALQQYYAAAVLTRTMLEVAIRDVYQQAGYFREGTQEFRRATKYFDKQERDGKRYVDRLAPGVSQMLTLLADDDRFGVVTVPARDLYDQGSRLVHGRLHNGGVSKGEALRFFQKGLTLVQALYEPLAQ